MSHRRIKMDLMAQRMGKTRFETERTLGEAIDHGLVKGVIDRTADEFVAQDGDEGWPISSADARIAAELWTRGTSPRSGSLVRIANAL